MTQRPGGTIFVPNGPGGGFPGDGGGGGGDITCNSAGCGCPPPPPISNAQRLCWSFGDTAERENRYDSYNLTTCIDNGYDWGFVGGGGDVWMATNDGTMILETRCSCGTPTGACCNTGDPWIFEVSCQNTFKTVRYESKIAEPDIRIIVTFTDDRVVVINTSFEESIDENGIWNGRSNGFMYLA